MLKLPVILLAAILATGCASAIVKFNDGQRVQLATESYGTVADVQPRATELCGRSGKATAVLVASTVAGPSWWPEATRLFTFECR